MGAPAERGSSLVELEGAGEIVDSYGRAMSHREVAEELVELGFAADVAAQAVSAYIDDTSERLGVRVDDWTLDEADVDVIAGMACASAHAAAAAGDPGDEAGDDDRQAGDDHANSAGQVDVDENGSAT